MSDNDPTSPGGEFGTHPNGPGQQFSNGPPGPPGPQFYGGQPGLQFPGEQPEYPSPGTSFYAGGNPQRSQQHQLDCMDMAISAMARQRPANEAGPDGEQQELDQAQQQGQASQQE